MPVGGLASGVMTLTVAAYHNCVIMDTGGVKCWGSNYIGQLGNGTLYSSSIPLDIANLDGPVVALALPGAGSCALTNSGAVKCWGDAGLSEPDVSNKMSLITPTLVSGLDKDVTAISAGPNHVCALINTGTVKCWGKNYYGQLGAGVGLTQTAYVPIAVEGLGDEATAIAAGGTHTCALLKSGTIKCWGYNRWGQLGNNQSGFYSFPQGVTGLNSGVAAVGLGNEFSCALLQTSNLKCWGYGIGDGTSVGLPTDGLPTDMVNLTSGVKAISANGYNACALNNQGVVKCWGSNWAGQLGTDTSLAYSSIPLTISNLAHDVSALAVSYGRTCTLMNSGGVLCWGVLLEDGALNTSIITSTIPVAVEGLTGTVKTLAAGRDFHCVLTRQGGVKCWGNNAVFQLGIGFSSNFETKPKDVTGLTSGVKVIAIGYRHTCALLNSGSVVCWGHNNHGQLGDGTKLSRPTPVAVTGLRR